MGAISCVSRGATWLQADSSDWGERLSKAASPRVHHRYAHQQGLYLITPMLAVQTPLAEVLTVVRQHPVEVLPYARARPLDHLSPLEFRMRVRFDPYRAAAGKSSQGDFLDRPPLKPTCESRVVHDFTAAHVDSVMHKTTAGCNEVGAQRRLLTLGHQLFRASHAENPLIVKLLPERCGE